MRPLVLASTSRYRAALLDRLPAGSTEADWLSVVSRDFTNFQDVIARVTAQRTPEKLRQDIAESNAQFDRMGAALTNLIDGAQSSSDAGLESLQTAGSVSAADSLELLSLSLPSLTTLTSTYDAIDAGFVTALRRKRTD